MIIGITGGIACGKSYISNIIREHNIDVYSADEIAHSLYLDAQISSKLKAEFGNEIYENGILNRKNLADIVFNDKEKLNALNEIMHTAVYEKIEQIKKDNKKNIICFEIPLLYETKREDIVDVVINCYADEKTQINRLFLRDKLSEEDALLRIRTQMPNEIKIQKSKYNVNTGINDSHTRYQIENILKELMSSE